MIGCAGTGAMKDSDKLKLMLLAWNYHNQAQGNTKNTHPNTLIVLFCFVKWFSHKSVAFNIPSQWHDLRTVLIPIVGAGNRNGDIPDLSSVPGGEEMAGLWAQYHSALGLAKGKATPPTTRDQSVSTVPGKPPSLLPIDRGVLEKHIYIATSLQLHFITVVDVEFRLLPRVQLFALNDKLRVKFDPVFLAVKFLAG
jgi:hypothetical protein